VNHEYAQDRARSRFANTSHHDQETIGLKKMTHARGTDQFAVVQPDAVSDEEFVEETTELQLDGGVDTESETSEQLADIQHLRSRVDR